MDRFIIINIITNFMSKKTQKILIVEDEKPIAKAYGGYLSSQGYSVEVAFDGEEGFKKAGEFNPDLILLDIMLPKLDGISVLKKLKEDSATAEIPVIMLTNINLQDKVAEALAAGSVHYLIKADYPLEDLGKKVKELLKS